MRDPSRLSHGEAALTGRDTPGASLAGSVDDALHSHVGQSHVHLPRPRKQLLSEPSRKKAADLWSKTNRPRPPVGHLHLTSGFTSAARAGAGVFTAVGGMKPVLAPINGVGFG